MNTQKSYIIVLLLILTNSFCVGQTIVKQMWHKQVYNDVFFIEGNDTINLTSFKPWEEIAAFSISSDSAFCFVRHKPNIKNTSYRLSLYNVKTRQLIKKIIPGYGGDFEWNNNNQIIHSWGCGTNCANLRVYNLQLREIFFTLSSGGFKYSPEKNFIVQFSMHGDKLWVFDLKSLNKRVNPLTYSTHIDFKYDWDDFIFSSEFEISILCKSPKAINLKDVSWIETNPIKIGEFYERNER